LIGIPILGRFYERNCNWCEDLMEHSCFYEKSMWIVVKRNRPQTRSIKELEVLTLEEMWIKKESLSCVNLGTVLRGFIWPPPPTPQIWWHLHVCWYQNLIVTPFSRQRGYWWRPLTLFLREFTNKSIPLARRTTYYPVMWGPYSSRHSGKRAGRPGRPLRQSSRMGRQKWHGSTPFHFAH
jgi:hypothetical protein